jgi:hypothetical protein
MKLENVEDLLQDIFEVSEQGLEIEKFWLETTKILYTAIDQADDLLVIQTKSERYEGCQPYLQICYEDDRAMTIEAVSNKFLDQPLSIDAQNTMMELGWTLSDDEGLPNYMQFLTRENADSMVVAQLFAKTLRVVYGISTSDSIAISTGSGFWPKENEDSFNDK